MKVELSQVEAAGGSLLVCRREIHFAETSNLQRWIVSLHLVNLSRRHLRLVLMRLPWSRHRLGGLGLLHRRCGRALRRQHRPPRSRLPRLQLRDALLQLLNALEQHSNLFCLIWRGRTLPPCSA